MRIIGLDLSLTNTGCAEWYDGSYRTHRHGRAGTLADTLAQRANRLDDSRLETLDWVYDKGNEYADLVLVESHTFAAKGGSQHDRSGLWWLVVEALIANGTPVVEVTPQGIKQFATGRGNAGKDEVLSAVIRRHPDVEFRTNDEADALTLVDIGLARWSHEYFDPNLIQQKVIDKIAWPS